MDLNETDRTYEPIDYSQWLIGLISWDSLVPLLVIGLPRLAHRFGPQNNDRAILLAITFTLTAAVMVRFYFGMRHIHQNHCGTGFKFSQRIALVLAILLLAILECVMAVLAQAPLALPDVVFLIVCSAFYLLVMAFVLYPGRRPRCDSKGNTSNRYKDWEDHPIDSNYRF